MGRRPLCIDLFCGLGGWTEGFLAEGYDVIGFDIEQHVYGEERYPAQLVIQDVLTIHGSQFKDAAVIVASSPCQAYSYMAMPWTRAKQIAAALRGRGDFPTGYAGARTIPELNALFEAPRRIQREACEAAGRFIPMIQENVKGAQPWVGPAQWNYGSFFFWGDVPALMPVPMRAQKFNPDGTAHGVGSWFAIADSKNRGASAIKNTGGSWFNVANSTTSGKNNNPARGRAIGEGASPDGLKTIGHVNKRDGHGHTRHLTNQAESDAVKQGGDWFGRGADCSLQRRAGSKTSARKAASARIAKIPFPLANHIARCFHPGSLAESA